jgi:hypothetical protein
VGEKKRKRKSGAGRARMVKGKIKERKEVKRRKERTRKSSSEEKVGARTFEQASKIDELVRTSKTT